MSESVIKGFAAAFGIAGLIGGAWNLYFINNPGPVLISDHVAPAWFAVLTLYNAALAVARLGAPPPSVFERVLTGVALLAAPASAIAYSIAARPSAAVWAFVLTGALVLVAVATNATDRRCRRYDGYEPAGSGGFEMASLEGADAPRRSRSASRACRVLLDGCELLLLVITTVCTGFLIGGAAVAADQALSYPLRGSEGVIQLRDGNSQRIAYVCEGPAVDEQPTVVLEADGSHGQADFWPLQADLVGSRIRTCVFDKPGLGWSGDFYARQTDGLGGSTSPSELSLYPMVFDLFGPGPLVLAGWGGGGSVVHQVARRPELSGGRVVGVVLLGAYSGDVEYQVLQATNGWNDTETAERRAEIIDERLGFFNIIRGVLAPFGLLSIIAPYNPDSYALPDRYDEYRSFYASSHRTWTIQRFWLASSAETPYSGPDSLGEFDEPLPAGIAAAAVVPFEDPDCTGLGEDECAALRDQNRLYFDNALAVAESTVGTGAPVAVCSPCSLGFVLSEPRVAGDAIRSVVLRQQELADI